MKPFVGQAAHKVRVKKTVPCTARYERVDDSCSARTQCAPTNGCGQKMASGSMHTGYHPSKMETAAPCAVQPACADPCGMDDCGLFAGLKEWLFPWLFWVLPAIILVSAALGSLGANDFATGPWTFDNPLRYADWAFWTGIVLVSVLYGIMWGCLYNWGTTQDREPWLGFLISVPLWLGLAYIIVLYGADMPKEATYIGYVMIAATVVVAAIVAGVSPYPEIVSLILLFLAWIIYEVALAQQEAIARG